MRRHPLLEYWVTIASRKPTRYSTHASLTVIDSGPIGNPNMAPSLLGKREDSELKKSEYTTHVRAVFSRYAYRVSDLRPRQTPPLSAKQHPDIAKSRRIYGYVSLERAQRWRPTPFLFNACAVRKRDVPVVPI